MADNKGLTIIGGQVLHMKHIVGTVPYDPDIPTDGHGHTQAPDGSWYEMEPPNYDKGVKSEKQNRDH